VHGGVSPSVVDDVMGYLQVSHGLAVVPTYTPSRSGRTERRTVVAEARIAGDLRRHPAGAHVNPRPLRRRLAAPTPDTQQIGGAATRGDVRRMRWCPSSSESGRLSAKSAVSTAAW
jgi:hypothetical protein